MYAGRDPTSHTIVPLACGIVFGGRGVKDFLTNATAFMHQKWLDWGNPPVQVMLMDKEQALWAGYLTAHKDYLAAASKRPDLTDLNVMAKHVDGMSDSIVAEGSAAVTILFDAWNGGVGALPAPPPALPPPSEECLAVMVRVFRPDIIQRYKTLLPFIAKAIRDELLLCIRKAELATSWSQWEEAWDPLRRFSSLLKKSGPTLSGLARFFVLHVDPRARLCIWHALEAVKRHLFHVVSKQINVDPIMNAFRQVAFAESPDEFETGKVKLYGLLVPSATEATADGAASGTGGDGSGTDGSDGSGTDGSDGISSDTEVGSKKTLSLTASQASALRKYFDDHWFSPRWLVVWPQCQRHFASFFARTTGVSESMNSLYKSFAGLFKAVPIVMCRVMGPPAKAPHSSAPLSLLELQLRLIQQKESCHEATRLPDRAKVLRKEIEDIIKTNGIVVDLQGVFTFTPCDATKGVVTTDPILLRCTCEQGKAAKMGDALCAHVFAAQYLGIDGASLGKITWECDMMATPARSPHEDLQLFYILGHQGRNWAKKHADRFPLRDDAWSWWPDRPEVSHRQDDTVVVITDKTPRPPVEALTPSLQSTGIAYQSSSSPPMNGGPASHPLLPSAPCATAIPAAAAATTDEPVQAPGSPTSRSSGTKRPRSTGAASSELVAAGVTVAEDAPDSPSSKRPRLTAAAPAAGSPGHQPASLHDHDRAVIEGNLCKNPRARVDYRMMMAQLGYPDARIVAVTVARAYNEGFDLEAVLGADLSASLCAYGKPTVGVPTVSCRCGKLFHQDCLSFVPQQKGLLPACPFCRSKSTSPKPPWGSPCATYGKLLGPLKGKDVAQKVAKLQSVLPSVEARFPVEEGSEDTSRADDHGRMEGGGAGRET